MKLKYTIDDDGKEILIDENEEHQVMMQWEKPYMEKCIELLNPFGKVLEIGFGMGYSASKIEILDINYIN
jgi:protein-L-isoaspartate O-methyltransferase